MHFVALVWLTLLHALSLSAALRSAEVVPVTAAAQESGANWTFASAPSSRHAVRAPAQNAAALVSQPSGVVTPDRSDATPLERATHTAAACFAPTTRNAAEARRNSVASRGGLLPYFPTAPPQGV